jgi:hypothetical protein
MIISHVLSMHIFYKAYLKLIVVCPRLLCLDQLGSNTLAHIRQIAS